MKNEVLATVADMTDFYVNRALQGVMEQMSSVKEQETFQSELQNIANENISALFNGVDFESSLKQSAIQAAQLTATTYTKDILSRVVDKLPNGKSKEIVQETLSNLVDSGIEAICDGSDMDDVFNQMETQLSIKTKEYLKTESAKIGESWIDSLAGNFKDKGRGKGGTKKNRNINAFSGHIKTQLAMNISENLDALWQGNKDLPTAFGDVAFDTAVNAAEDFVKDKAEEIGNKVLKSVTKTVEKELVKQIENKAVKGALNAGLKKVSNVQGLMELKDAGTDIMNYLDGKMSGIDLVQSLTDRTAEAVSTVVEKLVTALALPETGTAAPAIGYAAGYIASSFIRGAIAPILNAARRKKWAKERYEQVHAMSEIAIKRMQEQRRLFEAEVENLLGKRQVVIDDSFHALNKAIISNDVNAASAALNKISKEFGGNNKLSTFEEFDDFIMNGEGEITW